MDSKAPQLLNVLRVCDIPEALGFIAPRGLTIHGWDKSDYPKAAAIYAAASAAENLAFHQ
jgi:hypothetical protein